MIERAAAAAVVALPVVESIHFLISHSQFSERRLGCFGLVLGFLPSSMRERIFRDNTLDFPEIFSMGELLAGEMELGSIETAVFSTGFSYRVQGRKLEQLAENGGLGSRFFLDQAQKSNQQLDSGVQAIVGVIKTEVLDRDPLLEEQQFNGWVNTVKKAGLSVGWAFCLPGQQPEYLQRLIQQSAEEIDRSRFQSDYLNAFEAVDLEDFE